ncbi:hypothetical protein [Rothia sp. ZJ1223]|uniref:hypothetical protein n=1 Tax=Rothia sp. ZJ1223 TaxID=2811098 RepID=UPI00195E9C6C|nr:hypothetical protein [Rothia sp. ZJ1223]MBM7051149.1 hypothetical protein [Rothia sp. ZJ1223]
MLPPGDYSHFTTEAPAANTDATLPMPVHRDAPDVRASEKTSAEQVAFSAEETVPFTAESTQPLAAHRVVEPQTSPARPKVSKLENLEAYGDGNWGNPSVQAPPLPVSYQIASQPSAQPTAAYRAPQKVPVYAPPAQPAVSGYASPAYSPPTYAQPQVSPVRVPARKPRFSALRRLLCVLLVPVFLALGSASALAYWVQSTIINPASFKALSASMAYDTEFQGNLARAAADDFMNSSSATAILGDGNSTAWYGGAQNWLHNQVNTVVHDSAQAMVNHDSYPKVWETVMADTHAYLFNGERKAAAIDLNYFYDQLDAFVGKPLGFDLNADADQRLILLDGAEGGYPINGFVQSLMNFADSWQILTALTIAVGAFMFALWPGRRLLFAAIVGFLGAGMLTLGGALAHSSAFGTDAFNIPTSTGQTFVQQLISTFTYSLASFNNSLAGTVALVSAGLLVLAVVVAAVRGITRRTA